MLPYAINGKQLEKLNWLDEVILTPGDTVDLLVEMRTPGTWLLHAHPSPLQPRGSVIPITILSSDTDEESENSYLQFSKIPERPFSFSDEFNDTRYTVENVGPSPISGRKTNVRFAIRDASGAPVILSTSVDLPLVVTFVNKKGDFTFQTFPGKKLDEDSSASALKGSPLNFIERSYAHGTPDEKSEMTGAILPSKDGVYVVPAVFPTSGPYKAFVQFIPDGLQEVVTLSYVMRVREQRVSIDNFGWNPREEWWILFLSSIFAILSLVYIVRKYLNRGKNDL